MFKFKDFSYEDVISKISYKGKKVPFVVNEKTYHVKMGSQRYIVFKKQRSCYVCGLNGIKFTLETSDLKICPHFNLYGHEFSQDVLMTKDHIIPRSKGGKDIISNYNTVCVICNNLKSNEFSYEQTLELRNIWNENYLKLDKNELRNLINNKQNLFRNL